MNELRHQMKFQRTVASRLQRTANTLKHPLNVAQKQRKANMLKEKLTYNNAICKLNQNVPKV